jgi:hypothetical protein
MEGALGRSAPLLLWLSTMEKVALDRLRFFDLRGEPAALPDYFQDYLLLILLRHLS